MPAVARELTITYGTTSVGGTTDRLLDASERPFSESITYEQYALSFDFVTTNHANEAALRTDCTLLEAAFSTPRQRLQVVGATGSYLDLNPADNSGFEARASIEKAGATEDTARSRRYRVSIVVQLPADLAGQAGRRGSSWSLGYDASDRRSLTFEGEYTALAGNTALQQYTASIAAHVATVQALAGGIWGEKGSETIRVNDTNTVLSYQRTFIEILLAENAGATNDTDLVEPQLDVARARSAPGDAPLGGQTVERLVTYHASYSAGVRTRVNLRTKWEGTIRPWILAHVQQATGATALAVMEESPRFDQTRYRIEATMTLVAPGSTKVLSATVTTEDADDPGNVLVPAWVRGTRHAKYLFEGPALFSRQVTEVVTVLGTVSLQTLPTGARRGGAVGNALGLFGLGAAAGIRISAAGRGPNRSPLTGAIVGGEGGGGGGAAGGGQAAAAGGRAGLVPIGPQRTRVSPRRLGLPPNTLDLTDITTTTNLVYYEPVRVGPLRIRTLARAAPQNAGG